MFKKYSELLEQETQVLKSALEAEIEKRRCIFSADGKKLQALTEKTGILMGEVAEIASVREGMFLDYANNNYLELSGPVTLTQFCLLADEKAPELSQKICRIVDEYRNTAFLLKQETEENGLRLTQARDTIHRLLESLSADEDTIYRRTQDRHRKKYSGSVIVNANA